MLLLGSKLNSKQRAQVSAFVNRWTVENQTRATTNMQAIGLPTIEPVTDDQWLTEHAFYFIKDGSRLSANRKHAEPACLCDASRGIFNHSENGCEGHQWN